MTTKTRGRNDVISSLNVAIDALNLAKEVTTVTSAKAAFTSAGVLLAMIRVGSFRSESVDCRLTCTGLGGLQSGLCRSRVNLRRCL